MEKQDHVPVQLKIEKSVIDSTDRCKNNFSCLEGKHQCLCEVETLMDDMILFVKPGSYSCSYVMSYGYSYICNCPVRKALYAKHGK